jgi:hypothetical protein
MGSRLGRPNRDKQVVRELAAQYGVEPLEIQYMMIRDLKKTYDHEINKPRSRRSKQFFDVEAHLAKMLAEVTPYLHGKRANITTVDETPRLTVIRAPAPISDSQAWLEAYGPQRAAVNDQPTPVQAFAKNLKNTLDIADDLGIQDVKKIVSEAKKWTDEDKA